MRLPESSYGFRKRLLFMAEAVRRSNAKAVLDIGCGTGALVTDPLAELFPETDFLGVDSDPASIEFARRHFARPNLAFAQSTELSDASRFDLVITSEVLEHVERPDEFLLEAAARMRADGLIALTTPNGYGPFELAATLHAILVLTRTEKRMRALKRSVARPNRPRDETSADTLALSPHVNFFSRRELRRLLAQAGFTIVDWRSRTLLSGYGLSALVNGERASRLNATLADALPKAAASDWMVLGRRDDSLRTRLGYKRSTYGRAKRALSLRSARIAAARPSEQSSRRTSA